MALFIVLGLLGLLFFAVSLVFGDHDVGGHDHDFGHGHDGGDSHGGSVFSVFNISWFMIGFGGAGTIATVNGISFPKSCATGVIFGAVCLFLAFLFMKAMHKQQANSTLTTEKLVTICATVSLSIPAGGIGKIQCNTGDGFNEFVARSENGQSLPAGTPVRIVSQAGGICTVKVIETRNLVNQEREG